MNLPGTDLVKLYCTDPVKVGEDVYDLREGRKDLYRVGRMIKPRGLIGSGE